MSDELKFSNFAELITFLIGSEELIGLKNNKKIIKKLEEIRDIIANVIYEEEKKQNKNHEKIGFYKRFFCIRRYDKALGDLMNDLERKYWRIIKSGDDFTIGEKINLGGEK